MAASLPVTSTSTEPQERVARLRAVFAAMVLPVAARYAEVVGANMAAGLQVSINDVARSNQWSIRVNANELTDTHTFETPDAAARAYRVLARTVINHMGMVIGGRLANAIMRDVTKRLEPAQREVAQTYHLVPESILPGPAR
jgi:hypothetical protein